MRRLFLTGSLIAGLLMPTTASAKLVSAFGVTIVSCVVNASGSNTNGINVVYYSSHDSPATEVDFQVKYEKHSYTLIDRGTFTRGSQINHNLNNALTGMPWNGAKPKLCTVSRVVLQNGTVLE
ncbi:MAG TPA: hypothetical protein VGX91_14795 [Candidatus Cybelea sp.]|jgi:hypothetical protein|nr:hypothetical protein [Candidatus Cybelea sp.]